MWSRTASRTFGSEQGEACAAPAKETVNAAAIKILFMPASIGSLSSRAFARDLRVNTTWPISHDTTDARRRVETPLQIISKARLFLSQGLVSQPSPPRQSDPEPDMRLPDWRGSAQRQGCSHPARFLGSQERVCRSL